MSNFLYEKFSLYFLWSFSRKKSVTINQFTVENKLTTRGIRYIMAGYIWFDLYQLREHSSQIFMFMIAQLIPLRNFSFAIIHYKVIQKSKVALSIFRLASCYTLQKKEVWAQLFVLTKASKFAIFIEKETPHSVFIYHFKHFWVFTLWMPWSMST